MKRKENGIKNLSDKEKKIKKVERSVLSVLLALVIAAVAFVAGWFGRWGALGEKKRNLLWAIDTAKENYYRDIEDELYDNLFAAFELDPYSTYYTKEEYAVIAAEQAGQNRDAGFSIWQESYLEVCAVIEGSSAEAEGIESGMHLLKYGKTQNDLKAGTIENYYSFVATLGVNEKYYVLCGESERESEAEVYEVTNGENGAGIALMRKYEPMRVYQVVGNSPADLAGLRRGMYILKYGKDENVDRVSGLTSDFTEFVKDLKQKDEEGNVYFYMQCAFDKEDDPEPVKIIFPKSEYRASYCVYRDSSEACRYKTVNVNNKDELEKVSLEGEALTALDDKTAYIALTQFTGNVVAEFKACLKLMHDNGRTNLIIDLRGNGGGYLTMFREIAACLLKDAGSGAQKVAYAKFKSGATVSYSVKRSSYYDYFQSDSRVSILADEYTASASECLIGALVDYNTVAFSDIYLRENESGVAKTYGKGIMQTHYDDSPSGDILKLTSAEIFWPKSNRSIHGVGVTAALGEINAVSSPLLPDANDKFLQDAIAIIKGKASVNAPSANL